MAEDTFTVEEVLEQVAYSDLDENELESDDSEEEFVADLQDEDGHVFLLPEPVRHNIPAHERESALSMDHEVNSVSALSVVVYIFLFSLFTEISL